MRRSLLALGLVTLAVTASAQQAPAPAPSAAPAPAPSAGDKCLSDLPQWQQFATMLKSSRDDLETQLATIKAENASLKAQLEAAKKK